MKGKKITLSAITTTLLALFAAQQASAAIALDRTRAIFDGHEKSISLNIRNENKELPYLAQGWVEDDKGNKITSPLVVLPPVQRIEPGAKSQVKVQGLPQIASLAQDRETLFYFNLREIPPRSNKPNTLQIALQTRIKMFYRPETLIPETGAAPWQEKLTLTKVGDKYQLNNPTPYYVTLVDGSASKTGASAAGFEPVMVAPKGQADLTANSAALGNSPVLTYIDDYGARPQLQFSCTGSTCTAKAIGDKS